jgi:hypothetical protein
VGFVSETAVPSAALQPCLSVALSSGWQAVLTRPENVPPGIGPDEVKGFLRYLAAQGHRQEIHFLWRPCLPDPDDDLVLELAFAAGATHIVTDNVTDFRGSDQLGVAAVTPREFLRLIRSAE